MLTNFLSETLEMLSDSGHSPDDVLYITNGRSRMTWSEFEEASRDINYYISYGDCEIDLKLKIVFRRGWLERCEYDGSEWWEFRSIPRKPRKNEMFKLTV